MKNKIKDQIYSMYAKKEYVTMANLRKHLIDQIGEHFNASISALRRWCKSIGFKWKRTSNRQYLMELPDIQMKRMKFLREYTKNQEASNGLTPVFLDETWIYSKGSFRSSWQDDTIFTSSTKRTQGNLL